MNKPKKPTKPLKSTPKPKREEEKCFLILRDDNGDGSLLFVDEDS